MICPLCENPQTLPFWCDQRRAYRRCDQCLLVFVPTDYHLSSEAERAEYDLHRNDPEDAGYRKFLSRLFGPLRDRLPVGARGLDFGSGPGPALALMLADAGFDMAIYDPIYAPQDAVLQNRYDFIACSEVVEHFRMPGREFATLWQLLEPGGWLGIMTKLVLDRQAFSRWHYKNDPTHISFFSRETFSFLAEHLSAHLQFVGSDVILLRKSL
jgi:hypothetical protein